MNVILGHIKKKSRYYIFGSIGVFLAVIGVIHIYTTSVVDLNTDYLNSSPPISGVSIDGNGIVTEEETSTVQAPDFTRKLMFDENVAKEIQVLLEKKFDDLQVIFASDTTNFSAWIESGILRKAAGDYMGAAEDWGYVAKLYPKSTIPFDNLGDLYLNFLKDYPKAEANFKTSIAFNPNNIHAYQQLFALYTLYGYKTDTSAATNLVSEGLKKNPGNETLLQMEQALREIEKTEQ